MIPQTATPSTSVLSREEEYSLFTRIWHHAPDAPRARETLIQDNLKAVRNFILKQPALYWYDQEDAQQEAYLLLATAIEKVPPSATYPGVYLYKSVCRTIQHRYALFEYQTESLDAVLPTNQTLTLHDILQAPPPQKPCPLQGSLFAALHRLSPRQQETLQALFHLPDFQPQTNGRRDSRSHQEKKPSGSTKRTAFQELRNDSALQQAIEPLYNQWTHAPAKTLKYYRLLHRWSQRRVAETLEVTAPVVGSWENGTRYPSASHREKLCQLYGVPAEQLGLKGA